jgi:hypothetical protein
MPSFLNPLSSNESRIEKRKFQNSEQCEISSNKKQATNATLPTAAGNSTQYWMVQWYVSSSTIWKGLNGAPSKEGPSSEETQDMGRGWRPRRDQAKGCSPGPGRPRVCAGFLFNICSLNYNLLPRLTTGSIGPDVLEEGAHLTVGNKELHLDRAIEPSEYLSGSCFGRGGTGDTPLPPLTSSTALSKQFIPLKPVALNPSSVRLSASREASIPQRKVIELEPINLLSPPVVLSSRAESEGGHNAQSHWTANW